MTTLSREVQKPSVGFAIEKLRKSHNLSQKELAAAAGVSEQEVETLENDQPLPLDIKMKILWEIWNREIHPALFDSSPAA